MSVCICKCGSYAINPGKHGRGREKLHLCDVCYWRERAEAAEGRIAEVIGHRDYELNQRIDAERDRDAFVRLLDADGNVVSAMVALRAMLAENKWHPVSEPPNDNRNVWCHGTIDEKGFYEGGRWHYFDDDGQPLTWDNYLPTHWREIPKFREGV